MLSHIARRCYSTQLPSAWVARSASAPLAVRIRRAKKAAKGITETAQEGDEELTLSEHTRYNRLKALKTLRQVGQGNFVSKQEWIENINMRRTRLRGLTNTRLPNGDSVVDVIGRPVYLPNVIFRFVRNHTKPGEAYNPYEATFKIPISINKPDIRSYLKAMYNLDVTYIRTDIYYPTQDTRSSTKKSSYKKAVVGLIEPFYYPERMEDMDEAQYNQMEDRMNRSYLVTDNIFAARQAQFIRGRALKGYDIDASYRPQEEEMGMSRKKIVQKLSERRAKKERAITQQVSEWRMARERKETITIKKSVPTVVGPKNDPVASPPSIL